MKIRRSKAFGIQVGKMIYVLGGESKNSSVAGTSHWRSSLLVERLDASKLLL